jgi:hypothetical protein
MIRHGGDRQLDPLARILLTLAVERLMICVLCRALSYAELIRDNTFVFSSRHPAHERRLLSTRHILAVHNASRKASKRSFGWKRILFPPSYGLSFARAASFSAR